MLEGAWDPYRGYCFPNPETYPHLWLWDSCFHAIAWAALGDARAGRELGAVFCAQLAHGFVPHMRYAGPTVDRGPLDFASSFTQPPVFAHAARVVTDAGVPVGPATAVQVAAGLSYLWERRMGPDGLLVVVHPWETGADDSPRWDAWAGTSEWDRNLWTGIDFDLLQAVTFDEHGAAADSSRFVVAPAAFNAIASHAAAELAAITGDASWRERSEALAAAIDGVLWDGEAGHWRDLVTVGDASTASVPTLDGLLPALVTGHEERARRTLAAAADRERFAAPYGLRYVDATDPRYRPGQYWRGSAWMQMNYLVRLAALRWGDLTLAEAISAMSARGAATSGFAEHWNPETGEGLGARPQSWAALVAAMV